jgi:chloride channel protein, CIC family
VSREHADVVAGTGFDVRPTRPLWSTVLLLVAVIVAAAGFAHLFKESAQRALEFYADSTDPTESAASLHRFVVFATVTASVVVAATIGNLVERHWAHHVGVEAVAASARGEGRSISLRATGVRAAATWIVSTGMVSIGRESAIIESGGAVGAVAGRRFGGRGDALAAAGIAAAFAAAYHAPVAALFYVGEHLKVWRSRRAVVFALLGAAGGFAVSVEWFDGHVIFPSLQGSQLHMLEMAVIALLPAVLISRVFLQLRVRVHGGSLARRLGDRRWLAVGALSIVAGAAVAYFPSASGNGMEALRHASVEGTLTLALALTVGKLIGTTASLGAGAPGGVLTPTISVASGCALLSLLGAESLGFALEHPWDAMVAAMAIGIAVGLRSPLMAAFLIPEFLGDYTLVPAIGLIVMLAVGFDRGLDRFVVFVGQRVPRGVYDEDA